MPAFVTVCHPGWATNVLSDPMVGGIFTGEDAGPGGAAYLAGGIAPGELHSFIGYTIDVRSFVKGGTLVGQVPGTEIVHQNKQYIRLLRQEAKRSYEK